MIVEALSKCSFDRNNIQFRFMLSYSEYNNAFFPCNSLEKLLSYDAENKLP